MQSPDHWSRPGSWVGLTRVNVRIKMVIIIILKPDLRVDSEQGPGHMLVGQPELIQVNMKIKMVIIVILKLDLGSTRGKT